MEMGLRKYFGLFLALMTCEVVPLLADSPGAADDPFQSLIGDIDKNVAPPVTPLDTVVIKGNNGETLKTISGGSEVVEVNSASNPEGTITKKKVGVTHITFSSVPVYYEGSYHDDTKVYAEIAVPVDVPAGAKLPGILLLHGGGYFVQNNSIYSRVLQWAAAGYVVVACDLPGIAGPLYADASDGTWKSVAYDKIPRFTVTPDIKASWIYTAEATALKAFALLKTQPDVDPAKLGIVGLSWGGYSTTMLCGLLGDRVAAGFSVFGCGYYDCDSAWKQYFLSEPPSYLFRDDPTGLATWKSGGASTWLAQLDAGRRASGIKAHFYIAAPANDHFFRPPAVDKTLQSITNAASLDFQFSPNSQPDPGDSNPGHDAGYYSLKSSHIILTPGGMAVPQTFKTLPINRGWCAMEAVYFDYWLKGVGAPLTRIKFAAEPHRDAKNDLAVNVTVTADPGVVLQSPKLYYSVHTPTDTWEKRNWTELATKPEESGTTGTSHNYSMTMPAAVADQGVDWYVLVSDKRGAWETTVSTLMMATSPPAGR